MAVSSDRQTTIELDLEAIKTHFKESADVSSKAVDDAIKELKAKPDDPARLAELQHAINKWSVVFNLTATTTRAIKDVMQSILQKV